ncbi:MAG TPA: hypothetical protein VHJ20_13035 [Polyangia bacterium]|nr:hypothetical protein [Polyangia bacterium]
MLGCDKASSSTDDAPGGHDGAVTDATDASSTGGGGGGGSGGTGGSSSTLDCSLVGCGPPPMCGSQCSTSCGCCPCGEGQRQDDLVCHGGCWMPTDASVDQ